MEKNIWKKLFVSIVVFLVVVGGVIVVIYFNLVDVVLKIIIKFWVLIDLKVFYKVIVKKFEKENKGVIVKMIEFNDFKV